MRKLLLAGLLVLACSGMVQAEEPIVNDPKGFYDQLKGVVDRLSPRSGVFWNLEANGVIATTGIRVASYEIRKIPIELVASYGVNKTVVASVETDVLKIAKKLGLNINVPVVSVHAGFGAGYSNDSENLVYGPTAEVSFRF